MADKTIIHAVERTSDGVTVTMTLTGPSIDIDKVINAIKQLGNSRPEQTNGERRVLFVGDSIRTSSPEGICEPPGP